MGGAVTIDRETESSSTEGLSGFSRGVVTVCSMTPALVAFRGRRGAGRLLREARVTRLIEESTTPYPRVSRPGRAVFSRAGYTRGRG